MIFQRLTVQDILGLRLVLPRLKMKMVAREKEIGNWKRVVLDGWPVLFNLEMGWYQDQLEERPGLLATAVKRVNIPLHCCLYVACLILMG